MFTRSALALTSFGLLTSAVPAGWPSGYNGSQASSQLITDPLTYGPELDLVHLYYDEFPTGKATARDSGEVF